MAYHHPNQQHYHQSPYNQQPEDAYYESAGRQYPPSPHSAYSHSARSAHSGGYYEPAPPSPRSPQAGGHLDSGFNQMHDYGRPSSPYGDDNSPIYDDVRGVAHHGSPSPSLRGDVDQYRPDIGHHPLPPPPSRSHGNDYDNGYNSSHDSYSGYGGGAAPNRRSAGPFGAGDPYADDPYQGFSSRNGSNNLGVVNPNEIVDDGDDGLHYHRSQRNSMMSLPHSDRQKQAIGTATAVGGTGAAAGGVMSRGYRGGSEYDLSTGEKMGDKGTKSKKWKWCVIILVFIVIVGAIVGGVVGSMVGGKSKGSSNSDDDSSKSGESAADDAKKNGDLDKNSDEIKKLLNDPDLHKVFPGMDYTPINSQYPDCLHNPPSQNNITRDLAVLSQLTNKIRLYGTDCNQTQMLIHAIDKLDLKKDIKIWLGVWQDGNKTTNARQLSHMWDILDEYGDEPFEGLIVANEILFREEMTETQLASLLADVRTNLTAKNMDLPVATSDLGDDWTTDLAKDSDYIMANIHPFFSGTTASKAADWTMNFWTSHNKPMWKSDKKKNIISETGWPTGGGTNCGEAKTCSKGSVAGVDELNAFMEDWVCTALEKGTQYFWFEAFDEPWKVRYNTKGKEWEDKWGLMDVNRKLKDGVKIPDCGGKTVEDMDDN